MKLTSLVFARDSAFIISSILQNKNGGNTYIDSNRFVRSVAKFCLYAHVSFSDTWDMYQKVIHICIGIDINIDIDIDISSLLKQSQVLGYVALRSPGSGTLAFPTYQDVHRGFPTNPT